MNLFYFTIFTIGLITGHYYEKKYILLLEEDDNRTTFENAVMRIEDMLDDRSGSGGELTSKFPFINAVGGIFSHSMIEKLSNDPMIEEIVPVTKKWAYKVQKNATWGLSRISSKSKNRATPYFYKYSGSGEGVSVYVIDTGVNVSHKEFQGRASFGTVTVENSSKDDKHGHGTHCAGTVAGKTHGVAKKARIVAVKVLGDDGFGDDESVIKGVQWAVKDAKSKGIHPILSMSLGGDKSKAVDKAVECAFRDGAIVIVAAGNQNEDACDGSPSGSKSMITVGSIDKENKKSSFSNYGKCVKILAPGTAIESTWIGSNTALNTISGTSMATPHVAGQVAVLWGEIRDRDKVIEKLYKMALRNQTTEWDADTPNLLLYNGQ